MTVSIVQALYISITILVPKYVIYCFLKVIIQIIR